MDDFLKNRGRKGIYEDLSVFLKKNYKKGKILLDLGCGKGYFSNLARKIGYEIKRTDYAPELCIFNDVKADKCDFNIEKLPYPDSFFDIVIMTEVIEHLYNPGFIFNEINRVLKTKGILYLTTPNLSNLKNKIWFLLFSNFLTHPKNPKIGDHIMHIPPDFLKDFLIRSEFKQIKIRYINSFLPYSKIKLPNNKLFSDSVVATAKKFSKKI